MLVSDDEALSAAAVKVGGPNEIRNTILELTLIESVYLLQFLQYDLEGRHWSQSPAK
jgi:hypothetical protein